MFLMVNLPCSKAGTKPGLQASEKNLNIKEEPGANPTTTDRQNITICK